MSLLTGSRLHEPGIAVDSTLPICSAGTLTPGHRAQPAVNPEAPCKQRPTAKWSTKHMVIIRYHDPT